MDEMERAEVSAVKGLVMAELEDVVIEANLNPGASYDAIDLADTIVEKLLNTGVLIPEWMAASKQDMVRFMSSTGTDGPTSNLIAGAVSDVWRAYFGDEWVPFSVRFGIANEVQRRLAQRPDAQVETGDQS